MKKIILHIILLFFPFALIVITVNYKKDVGDVFDNSEKYENEIAQVLLKNHNAQELSLFNERVVMRIVATKLDSMPQVGAIGTSRVLGLRQFMFPNKTFRNFACTKSNINDIIAQIGIFDSLNKFPKELYIETTPTYQSKEERELWINLHSYHKRMVDKLHLKNIEAINNPDYYFFKKKFMALTSLDNFQRSIFSSKKIPPKIVMDIGNEPMTKYGRYADGAISYSPTERKIDTIKVMTNAAVTITKMDLPICDENKMEILKQLIVYCQSKGVKISLLIFPIQPDCFTLMNAEKPITTIHTQRILQLAQQVNVSVYGSCSPFELNLGRKNFYDNIHCDDYANEQVLKNVLYLAK